MKRIFIFASMAIASGVLITNIYTSLVDVPAWSHDVPNSIEVARQYFKASNPGNFFRIFSPANQALGLIALLLFWKSNRQTRWLLLTAFVMYLVAEGMTFQYFYPRNDILFNSGITDEGRLNEISQQWRSMNWVRSLVVAIGLVCSGRALHLSYTLPGKSNSYTKISSVARAVASV